MSIHQWEYQKYKDFQLPEVQEYQYPRDLQPVPKTLTRTVYGFLPYWRLSQADLIQWDLLTHIACFGVVLNAQGQVSNSHGWPGNWAAVVDSAHAHGVKAHLVIIVFNADDIHSILTTYRDQAINTILEQVDLGNADGVNIDFELPYASDREALNTFMTLLADSLHARGKELTIDVTAVNWSDRFDPLTLAQVTDGLFIMGYDYHWTGSDEAGPVAPLTGWGYNVTGSVQYWVTQSGNARDKIILGVPYYGYDWPTVGPNPYSSTVGSGSAVLYETAYYESQVYGLLWDNESQTPWYHYQVGSQWHQTWFDNDSSLGLKYDLVNSQDLQGTGMWALTYDGTRPELWEAIASHFSQGAPPPQPSGLAVMLIGPRTLKVTWYPVSSASSYDVMESTDGVNFTLAAHVYAPWYQTGFLEPGEIRYYKVRATNAWGTSPYTEVLAAVASDTPNTILIVNGFDRVSGTINTFDFIKEHGGALHALGLSFNSCSNERIEDSSIVLTDYAAVDWILGEEGTATMAFSPIEQQRVADFLKNGGNLFLSGSEIGYDLWEEGNAQDHEFYHTYLKATYLGDDANTHSAQPASGGLFQGLGTIPFDDGTHGYYDVDYPDGVGPYGGSVSCLTYTGGTGWSAGIVFDGTQVPDTAVTGKLVYLGFPIETVYDTAVRLQMFARIFSFFGYSVNVVERPGLGTQPWVLRLPSLLEAPGWLVIQTSRNTIGTLSLWDRTGRRLAILYQGRLLAPSSRVSVPPLPSGVYFLRWEPREPSRRPQTQKITILGTR